LIFDKDTDSDGDCTDDPGTGSARYFYCRQANYNVVAMADSDGDVTEKVLYDPYGEATVWLAGNDGDWGTEDDVFQSVSSVANPYLFQGRRWDSEADLYYFRNRYYSPVLGRFLQRDPSGYADGMNLYEFVRSAPLGGDDPLGLRCICEARLCVTSSMRFLIDEDCVGDAAGHCCTPKCKVITSGGEQVSARCIETDSTGGPISINVNLWRSSEDRARKEREAKRRWEKLARPFRRYVQGPVVSALRAVHTAAAGVVDAVGAAAAGAEKARDAAREAMGGLIAPLIPSCYRRGSELVVGKNPQPAEVGPRPLSDYYPESGSGVEPGPVEVELVEQ